MKLYCMSFNVNLNGKNYSATLPRRFEKKENGWQNIKNI